MHLWGVSCTYTLAPKRSRAVFTRLVGSSLRISAFVVFLSNLLCTIKFLPKPERRERSNWRSPMSLSLLTLALSSLQNMTAVDHSPSKRRANLTHAVQMTKSHWYLPFLPPNTRSPALLREIRFLFWLPHTVPSPGYLSIPLSSLLSLRDTRFASSTLYTVYV